ncbi:MAG: S-methyl-5'-thioadenosine phosphorylase [Planctomycetota bacterium]|jgi:5'-methylthioadenosine phosphorylase
MIKIGIIGGSGLDDPKLLAQAEEIEVETPFGRPESPLTLGILEGCPVVILARHGRKHAVMPSRVNYRANIRALKDQGCTHVIATTACGSLRDEIAPGHLVFPDQFVDRTTKRDSTFYDKDRVCHIAMEEPFCPQLRPLLAQEAEALGFEHHAKGTLVTIEGPRFSTRAESRLFRAWACDIINMSTIPEAVLAREAAMCYHPIAMSTDYDCFKETSENVSWEQIVKIMNANVERVKALLAAVVPKVAFEECLCRTAIDQALV